MKKVLIWLTLVCVSCGCAAQKSWQTLNLPMAEDVASEFKSPPPEYAVTLTWGWDGPITEEVIVRDLDLVYQRGFRAVTIEAGYDMDNAPYLTEGWFKMVRFAVDQAKQRGMRVWIIDEGKYPSGFAGGLFTKERPDLRMQGLGLAQTIRCTAGEQIQKELDPNVVGVIAVNTETAQHQTLDITDGKIDWTVPEQGRWQLAVVDHNYRTPVTRAVNDSSRSKTTKNSVGDLIKPEAVKQFIAWTHEQYKTYLGDELGTTVLGFRGDEPEFAATPWTDGIVERFKKEKGYDITPYLPYLANLGRRGPRIQLTDEQRRAKADYWDIWSELYGKHFFGLQAKWCADHGVEHLTHLNNEHRLETLTFTSGDYFRDLREVQIPGVDSIWNQVWPGKNADFVRLPASVAHVYGKARVISESYAAYNESPVTVETALWGANYQLVRGINLFEFMFYPASAHAWENIRDQYKYMADPAFPGMMASVNRACYVMSQGRSAAKIAVVFPSLSFWYGDFEPDRVQWNLAEKLLASQHDFDFVDDDALAQTLSLKKGKLVNLSGQGYETVILPAITAISTEAMDTLKAFSKAGGQVIILGKAPSLEVEQSFMAAKVPTDMSWAVKESNINQVVSLLPASDVVLNQPCESLKVMHKQWKQADVYFMFNEAKETVTRQVTLTGQGQVQYWNTVTGDIQVLAESQGQVTLNVQFAPYEAKLIVIE